MFRGRRAAAGSRSIRKASELEAGAGSRAPARLWQTGDGAVECSMAARMEGHTMASVKEILVQEVERLSEEDAGRVLELLRSTKTTGVKERPELTREELIRRAAGRPGIHPPDPNAPPFRKVKPITCPGIPASELLIRDRR